MQDQLRSRALQGSTSYDKCQLFCRTTTACLTVQTCNDHAMNSVLDPACCEASIPSSHHLKTSHLDDSLVQDLAEARVKLGESKAKTGNANDSTCTSHCHSCCAL